MRGKKERGERGKTFKISLKHQPLVLVSARYLHVWLNPDYPTKPQQMITITHMVGEKLTVRYYRTPVNATNTNIASCSAGRLHTGEY